MDNLDLINLQLESINKQIKVMCEIMRIDHLIVPADEQPSIEELTDPDA